MKSSRPSWLFAIAAVVALASVVLVWPAAETQAVRLEVPSTVPFGHVSASKHLRTLTIRNPSATKITIESVVSSCGCTTPKIHTPLCLEPNASTAIDVHFDATNLIGQVRKRLVFHTDQFVEVAGSEKNIAHVVNITAFVESESTPSVLPKVLNLGQLGNWESKSDSVRVVNRGTVALKVEEVIPTVPWIEVGVVAESDQQAVLSVQVKPSDDLGEFAVRQRVQTSQGVVDFSIEGSRRHGVYLTNDVLAVSLRNGFEACTKRLVLRHPKDLDPRKIRVASDAWNIEDLGVELLDETTAAITLTIRSKDPSDLDASRSFMVLSFPPSTMTAKVDIIATFTKD